MWRNRLAFFTLTSAGTQTISDNTGNFSDSSRILLQNAFIGGGAAGRVSHDSASNTLRITGKFIASLTATAKITAAGSNRLFNIRYGNSPNQNNGSISRVGGVNTVDATARQYVAVGTHSSESGSTYLAPHLTTYATGANSIAEASLSGFILFD